MAALLLLCLLYCLVVSKEYEASARVALRMQSASPLSLEAAESIAPASILSTPLQLETLVNVFRSEQLAWRVITGVKLYKSAAFSGTFASRFPAFQINHPTPEAQSYLLDTFEKRLRVRTLPRTLLIEIRYRSRDPALAAQVVNALVADYAEMESQSRKDSTNQASTWLTGQLTALTVQAEKDSTRLTEFERTHGLLRVPQETASGQEGETVHDPIVMQIDEAGSQLGTASGERILREALYMEAQAGDPEQVLAANPELLAAMGPGGANLAMQLRGKQSDIDVELSQLGAEHGPNFPRVVELQRAQKNVAEQLKGEDSSLLEGFRRSWKAASDREQLLRNQLTAEMETGLKQNDATLQHAVLLTQVVSGRELIGRLQRRIQEAGLAAGVHASSITVVDAAREPFKPVTPDLPLYFAITLVAGAWLALGAALLMDAVWPAAKVLRVMAIWLGVLGGLTVAGGAQAPTPNTSGLPSGVVRSLSTEPAQRQPDPKEAPAIWNGASRLAEHSTQAASDSGTRGVGAQMNLPIQVGDFLEIGEFHVPEFRSAVRVSKAGTVLPPLVGEVKLLGMTEPDASRAIEKMLVDGGMLLHPQVTVLVTNAVGQDVSVLGEVARPGVYAYTLHHRLLDLISAASGLTPTAGRLVSVFHRDDPKTAHAVVLDPSGTGVAEKGGAVDHNPELEPGDTVLVSRAGLVYVIGDVVRPGGFAVDPVQGLTIVQALSLAWGSTPNASATKAILIRDQPGGRTLTTLNLRRMIRGEDPDQQVKDRDILFVPDSATKSLLNKTLESAIQSAIGVAIYAGLVYSQRF